MRAPAASSRSPIRASAVVSSSGLGGLVEQQDRRVVEEARPGPPGAPDLPAGQGAAVFAELDVPSGRVGERVEPGLPDRAFEVSLPGVRPGEAGGLSRKVVWKT